MPARNVYGKRPAAKQSLAERIFAASSSPVKPSPPRVLRETPERRRRCEGSVGDRVEAGELVEGMVGATKGLRVGGSDEGADAELGEERAEEAGEKREDRGALRSRDANMVARGPPRRRGEKAVANTSPPLAPLERPSNPLQPIVAIETVDQQAPSRGDIRVSQTDGAVSTSAGPKSRRRRGARTKGNPTTPSPQAPDHLTQYVSSLLRLSSDASASITPFSAWSASLATYFNITKIAEASFGEVYRLSLLAPSATLGKSDESVLKIIALKPTVSDKPLTPAEQRRIAAMSDVQDVANEIRLLRHLSPVPGFTNFRDIKMVKGRLPREFVAAWKTFNKEVKKSEFPDPSRKGTHGEDQLWAVVEMQDAGVDVESCIEKGAEVGVCGVWEVFWSVAGAVAKAEEYCGFEHRDLHLGNICIRPRPLCPGRVSHTPTNAFFGAQQDEANSILNPRPSQGPPTLETTIIDYTLSRALIPPNTTSTPTAAKEEEEDEATAFFDLSRDPAVFKGDASQEYQYAIYRYMRAAVLTGDPAASLTPTTTIRKGNQKSNKGRVPPAPPAECERAKWKRHHPLTNLVWLHFVLAKLVAAMDATLARRGRGLTGWEEKVLRRLRKLGEVLDIGTLGAGELRSTVGLLGWALGRGWLGVGEILGVEGGEVEEKVGEGGFDDLVDGVEKMEIEEQEGARRVRGGDGGMSRLDD